MEIPSGQGANKEQFLMNSTHMQNLNTAMVKPPPGFAPVTRTELQMVADNLQKIFAEMIGQIDGLHNSEFPPESGNLHAQEVQSTHPISAEPQNQRQDVVIILPGGEGSPKKGDTFSQKPSEDTDADNEEERDAVHDWISPRVKKPKKKRVHSKIQGFSKQSDDSDDDNEDNSSEKKATIRRRSKVGRNSWEYENLRCNSSYYLYYYS